MSYPGTYLKTEPFKKRYQIVADYLKGHTKDTIIVDLNCGEPGLCRFIKDYREYHCNDVFIPENVDGINFRMITDDQVDIKPDILCIFGYGAGEHTGHPMESRTAGQTVLRLAKYHPKFVIIESAYKWEEDYGVMSFFKKNLKNYSIELDRRIQIGESDHYHDLRHIIIFKHTSNHEADTVSDVELSDN